MNAQAWPEPRGSVRLVKSGRTPGHRTRILIVDRDPAAVAVVRSILRAQDWEVIVARAGREALDQARIEGPDAIIAGLQLGDMSGADLCRALHGRSETANTPVIILGTSSGVAERVASLRAGAADYLVKPPDAQELIARLQAALDLRKARSGFVVAVLGCKGGVGASTLAVNIAIALRHETRSGVALLDTATYAGAADIMLNLHAADGVGHLLSQLDEMDESDYEAILTPHTSGLQVLMLQEQGPEGIKPEELRQIVLALRRIRDYVVVDTGAEPDESTATVLELADRVLLIMTPEITSLRGAKLFLERAAPMGLSRERIAVVLNRFPLRGGLQRRDVENALGVRVQGTIPDDIKLITYSINRGVPVVASHGRSGIGRQVSALAKVLVKAAQEH